MKGGLCKHEVDNTVYEWGGCTGTVESACNHDKQDPQRTANSVRTTIYKYSTTDSMHHGCEKIAFFHRLPRQGIVGETLGPSSCCRSRSVPVAAMPGFSNWWSWFSCWRASCAPASLFSSFAETDLRFLLRSPGVRWTTEAVGGDSCFCCGFPGPFSPKPLKSVGVSALYYTNYQICCISCQSVIVSTT